MLGSSNKILKKDNICLEQNQACCVLLATRDRIKVLLERSIPSIGKQIHKPNLVLIVNDGRTFSDEEYAAINNLLLHIPVIAMENKNIRGAAGSWNYGLEHLITTSYNGFVAFLDDDDEWDPEHLLINLAVAREREASIVVSGLRLAFDGHLVPRELIDSLSYRQFLTGNPGWQGSNTFVHINLLRSVGGFRNGMPSANDRDLAIRLLNHPESKVAFTKQWTSTWHLSSTGDQLSSRGGHSKLAGLRWFWHFYGNWMTWKEADLFFNRAEKIFGISKGDIIEGGTDIPSHKRMLGDLHG